jgi:hypothetical protein
MPPKPKRYGKAPQNGAGNSPDRAAQVKNVIELIESGKSENAACKEVGINRATFRAAALREGVGDTYARALESLAHDQVERMETTIQDMRDGTIDAQIARVELDARKWFAARFLPKRYGDKMAQEISGPDGGPIEQRYKQMSDAELEALIIEKAAGLGIGLAEKKS